MIQVTIDDTEIKKALTRLAIRAANPAPALRAIGEDLVESTKKRFGTSKTPDGQTWAPNSTLTKNRFATKAKNAKAQARRSASKKPLIGETHQLQNTINYQLHGNQELQIGSPMEYAAMQNFGGKKSDYPHLWGDIPAREFLGISQSDQNQILTTIAQFLSS